MENSVQSDRDMLSMRKRIIIFLAPFGLLAALALGITAYVYTEPSVLPPPYDYVDNLYMPDDSTVCAGDLLTYRVQISLHGEPVVVMVVYAVWSNDMNDTAVFDTEPRWTILNGSDDEILDLARSYQVPATMQTGHYELRVAAQSVNSRMTHYTVPFEVVDCSPLPL